MNLLRIISGFAIWKTFSVCILKTNFVIMGNFEDKLYK